MRRSSVKEYAKAVEERYRKARRKEKGRLLDEFTRVTGYHRKSAIRLFSGRSKAASPSRSPMGRTGRRLGRPPEYGIEVTGALRVTWEATDRLCGKRLGPFLPELIGRLFRGAFSKQPYPFPDTSGLSGMRIGLDSLKWTWSHTVERRQRASI